MTLRGRSAAASRAFESGLVYSVSLPPCRETVWAWLADTHIRGGAPVEREGRRPDRELARVAEEIAAARPDGIVVNGDLAWKRGDEEDYRRFRALLGPAADGRTAVLGVGNHDRRRNLLAVFDPGAGTAPDWIAAVVEQPPYRLVALDSQRDPGEVAGEVGPAQLRWLESSLRDAKPARTILFVHHPGQSVSEGCQDFDRLVAVAEGCAGAEAIVTGHDHEFTLGEAGRLHHVGLPATSFPFAAGRECGWIEAALDPLGMRLRLRSPQGSRTHRLDWRRATSAPAPA